MRPSLLLLFVPNSEEYKIFKKKAIFLRYLRLQNLTILAS